jgi:hypothetical protein
MKFSAIGFVSLIWMALWIVGIVYEAKPHFPFLYALAQLTFSSLFVYMDFLSPEKKSKWMELMMYLDPAQKAFFFVVASNYLQQNFETNIFGLWMFKTKLNSQLTTVMVVHMLFTMATFLLLFVYVIVHLCKEPPRKEPIDIEAITANCFEIPHQLEKDAVCAICNEDQDSTTISSPCKHQFHKKCIHQWLEKSLTCPICRNPFH